MMVRDPAHPSKPVAPLTAALLRLIETVEEENGILLHHEIVFHAGFTDRKNQALRELMAAQRCEAMPSAAEQYKPLLRQLAESLRRNASLLKLHIAAVGEISDIIIHGMQEAESDGTYSRRRTFSRS